MKTSNKDSKDPGKDRWKDDIIEADQLSFSYDRGKTNALKEISLKIPKHRVTSLIGPSGCGKSTLLRCFNRMNDSYPGAKVTAGSVRVTGVDLYHEKVDPVLLRKKVGMVFQKTDPFPKSIYENVAFGLRMAGIRNKEELDGRVEESLAGAALWEEVKESLKEPASSLSVGQQQRLCIARTIAMKPTIILMDEPCSSLDPAKAKEIESLITELREEHTVVVVTQNPQQATRVSDHTAFFYQGELIESGVTSQVFTNPKEKHTEDFISGRFG